MTGSLGHLSEHRCPEPRGPKACGSPSRPHLLGVDGINFLLLLEHISVKLGDPGRNFRLNLKLALSQLCLFGPVLRQALGVVCAQSSEALFASLQLLAVDLLVCFLSTVDRDESQPRLCESGPAITPGRLGAGGTAYFLRASANTRRLARSAVEATPS